MWIFSKHGFYSIVECQGLAADTAEPTYLVRGRVRTDLESLKLVAKLSGKLVNKAGADYEWRIRIDTPELFRVMHALGESIDYPNFKAKIATVPSMRLRVSIYSEVWQVLRDSLNRLGRGRS